MQQPLPNNNNYNPQPSFNQNYMQQPMPNPEDITDPTTSMNMALILMAKAFKLNYSTPTNNNQRISSNPCNRQIAQPGMNMGQDRQMQMVGGNGGNQFRQYARQNVGNQNRYNEVQNVGNQNPNRNGNVVAVRAEGNANGNNGNQISCYNCRGLGHLVRNYIIRPRRRDAAYLHTHLLIAQKEEACVQLQAEVFDLIAAAADLNEIEETDKAPVYDSDGSAEKFLGTVHFGNDYVAAILDYGDRQWGNILITRVYFVEGLRHNLFSVGQFYDLDLEDIRKLGAKGDIGFFIGYSATSYAYRVYNGRTKKIMQKMNVAFDELSAMAFEQRSSNPVLQSMTSGQISLGLDLTYAPSTITTQQPTECLLCKIHRRMEYAKSLGMIGTKSEECKYDKIAYNKAYNNMKKQTERLQAQLGDQKMGGNSRILHVYQILVPMSQNLKIENNLKLLINSSGGCWRTVRFGNDMLLQFWVSVIFMGKYFDHQVYFVRAWGNCLGARQFCDSDLEVAFRRNSCFVRNLDGVDLLKGNRSTNLYTKIFHARPQHPQFCLMLEQLLPVHGYGINLWLLNKAVQSGLQADLWDKISSDSSYLCSVNNKTQKPSEGRKQQHVLHQPATSTDNVPNAMFDANTFLATLSSSDVVIFDPHNMWNSFENAYVLQPYPHDFQWTKDHLLEKVTWRTLSNSLDKEFTAIDGDCDVRLTDILAYVQHKSFIVFHWTWKTALLHGEVLVPLETLNDVFNDFSETLIVSFINMFDGSMQYSKTNHCIFLRELLRPVKVSSLVTRTASADWRTCKEYSFEFYSDLKAVFTLIRGTVVFLTVAASSPCRVKIQDLMLNPQRLIHDESSNFKSLRNL
ncbi:hypothetical protein Tco_0213807 [Tanacetum coccineum]